MRGLSFDIAHLLAGSLVLVSFMQLYQDRLYALLNIYALHALVLAASVAWQAFIQDAPHLYLTAVIALLFKAIVIPTALHRIIVRLGIHREIETVVGVGPAMLLGMGLVALSMVVMLRVTAEADPLAREDLAFSLVGSAAWFADDGDSSQCSEPGGRLHVAGEWLGAGGDRCQRNAAGGRNQRRLLGADRVHRHRHLLVPDPGKIRYRRRAGARPFPRRAAMIDALTGVLVIPAIAAGLLATLPGYRLTARLNVLAALLDILDAPYRCFVVEPAPAPICWWTISTRCSSC